MIIPIAVFFVTVVAAPFVAVLWHHKYTSYKEFRKNVISKEGTRRMRYEQWYDSVMPVFIVEQPSRPPSRRS